MNEDRVKGAIDEVVGTVKRKAGKWTGDTPLQIKGIAQQVKGGLENALGKAKDALHEVNEGVNTPVKIGMGSSVTDVKCVKKN